MTEISKGVGNRIGNLPCTLGWHVGYQIGLNDLKEGQNQKCQYFADDSSIHGKDYNKRKGDPEKKYFPKSE